MFLLDNKKTLSNYIQTISIKRIYAGMWRSILPNLIYNGHWRHIKFGSYHVQQNKLALQISSSEFEYVGGLHHCSYYDRCELWYCLVYSEYIQFLTNKIIYLLFIIMVEDCKYGVQFKIVFRQEKIVLSYQILSIHFVG